MMIRWSVSGKRIRAYLAAFTLIGLAACAKAPTPTLVPTPSVLHVAFTPDLQPVQAALQVCMQAHPEIALFVDEMPANQVNLNEDELALRLGMPGKNGSFAVPLGKEQIDVIVNPRNSIMTLSKEQLQALFTGKIRSWEQLNGENIAVQPWIFLQGDEVREIFDTVVFQGKKPSSEAFLAPDPSSMLAEIRANPGGVGYLPHAWVSKEVKALQLDSNLTTDLQLPVLALSQRKPQSVARIFLYCLQSGAGKTILEGIYPR